MRDGAKMLVQGVFFDGSAREVSAREVSATEVSAREVSATEVSAREVSVIEVSAREVSAIEVSAREVSIIEVSAREVSAIKGFKGLAFPKHLIRIETRNDRYRHWCVRPHVRVRSTTAGQGYG